MIKSQLDYVDFKIKNAIVNQDKNELKKIEKELKTMYRKYNDAWYDGKEVQLIDTQILNEYQNEIDTFWASENLDIPKALSIYRKEGWTIQKVLDSLKTVEFTDNENTLFGKRVDLYFKYGIIES